VSLLTIHLYLGFLVVLLALLAVWRRSDRRITLYVVTAQILLGIILMVQGLRVPALHPALAILAWAGYMGANALARRPGPARNALVVSALASILVVVAFGIGQMAVRHAAG
jgi:CHASE2 domain-containing sensor protein